MRGMKTFGYACVNYTYLGARTACAERDVVISRHVTAAVSGARADQYLVNEVCHETDLIDSTLRLGFDFSPHHRPPVGVRKFFQGMVP